MHQTTTIKGSPPPKTGTGELVDIASLDDEDSASSSDNEGLQMHSNQEGLMEHPPPLVLRKVRKSVQRMTDSYHQLPSLVGREGMATGVKWPIGIQAQDQQQGGFRTRVAQ